MTLTLFFPGLARELDDRLAELPKHQFVLSGDAGEVFVLGPISATCALDPNRSPWRRDGDHLAGEDRASDELLAYAERGALAQDRRDRLLTPLRRSDDREPDAWPALLHGQRRERDIEGSQREQPLGQERESL